MVSCSDKRTHQQRDELSNEEFDDALRAVHVQLSKHKVWRDEHGLEPNKGPASSQERFENCAHYVGNPKKYKFFSRTLFRH